MAQEKTRKCKQNRKRNKLIIFAAEGHNKTETYYFKSLTKDEKGIKLFRSRDASTDPVGMVNGLIATIKEYDFDPNEGDLAFCLIDLDCDRNKETQLKKAIQAANKNNIDIIVSNPCFELWYILHYTDSPKLYTSSHEVLKDVEAYVPNYDKARDDLYDLTCGMINFAIKNAERLEANAQKKGYRKYSADFSPSTDIYKVVKKIKGINGSL